MQLSCENVELHISQDRHLVAIDMCDGAVETMDLRLPRPSVTPAFDRNVILRGRELEEWANAMVQDGALFVATIGECGLPFYEACDEPEGEYEDAA